MADGDKTDQISAMFTYMTGQSYIINEGKNEGPRNVQLVVLNEVSVFF